MQWDTSEHDWLEGRGERLYLMVRKLLVRWRDYGPTLAAHRWTCSTRARRRRHSLASMIDDATSELTARFVRHDSSEENLRQLRHYVEQHGRPLAVSR